MTTDGKKNEERQVSRRQILRVGAGLIGAGLTLGDRSGFGLEQAASASADAASTNATMVGVKFEPRDVVRVGAIGVGGRGTGMLGNFLALEHVQVNAICDVVSEKAVHAQGMVEKAGGKKPEIYTNGEHDFENLCKRDDLDFIYVATPWDWHAPLALASMNSGNHVRVDGPAAYTVAASWQI